MSLMCSPVFLMSGLITSSKASSLFAALHGANESSAAPQENKFAYMAIEIWLGQPGSIPAFVQPLSGMAVGHRKGATAEHFFKIFYGVKFTVGTTDEAYK
ncbi:LOW QUALITY PROTEIN: hypothetical protein T265_13766, partial [Opisthorchis viverrini]